jgi:dTDP-4-dehydrorhamnose 3,5-epimerase-like enzyme
LNAQLSKVNDAKVIPLPKISNSKGSISIIENFNQIPFEVNRVYYLYDIPSGSERGGHAHRELRQLIVAASGSFEIILDDGNERNSIFLNRPNMGLLLPPGLWRELSNFSSGSICLVLASHEYLESDYIRNYNDFKKFKKVRY